MGQFLVRNFDLKGSVLSDNFSRHPPTISTSNWPDRVSVKVLMGKRAVPTQPYGDSHHQQISYSRSGLKQMGAKVFFSYSHKDEELRNELQVHLSMLQRQHMVESWHDRKLLAGDHFDDAIDANLNAADIILLLLSPDFLASDYCYKIEKSRALERAKNGEARLISVVLRPCEWQQTDLAQFLMTPTDALPVTKWKDRDDALQDIVKSIRRVIVEAVKLEPQVEHDWIKRPRPAPERVFNERDGALIQSLSAALPNQDIEYIRHHEFPAPFHPQALESLYAFYVGWAGPRGKLSDPYLNGKLDQLKISAADFLNKVTELTSNNPAYPYHRMSNGPTLPGTIENRSATLNTSAFTVVSAIDDLFTTANQIGYATL